MQVRVISATRRPEEEFWSESALGNSLRRLSFDKRLVASVAFANRAGLPTVYNAGMASCGEDGVLAFLHDDVWIDDHFFADRVLEGLRSFDVIGVAGNRRRVSGQPSWAFRDMSLEWDDSAFLSGAVAHGELPFGAVSWLGQAPAPCELLDGVFLAAACATLRRTGLRFDPQFAFHFYDLDFCRSARRLGLRLGTWPIALTHQSGGSFGSAQWRQAYRSYTNKWEAVHSELPAPQSHGN